MISAVPGQFFELSFDHLGYPDQWYLDEPRTNADEVIDAWEFGNGVVYQGPRPATVPIYHPGQELAFSIGPFDMPVVTTEVAQIVRRIAPDEIECFQVVVPGAKRAYEIVNVICALDCLDEEASEVKRWTEADGRPDRTGSIHVISNIRLDANRAAGHHIFRLKEWTLASFVSYDLKIALESVPDLGIVFNPVA